jgi:hypothetical protein
MAQYHPDDTPDYPVAGELDDRAQGDDLTLDEIAQLRSLDPTRYKQGVISLFASGEATAAQWDALATILRDARWWSQGRVMTATLFRERCTSTHEWVVMSQLVMNWSESSSGACCAPIDRGVLARTGGAHA